MGFRMACRVDRLEIRVLFFRKADEKLLIHGTLML